MNAAQIIMVMLIAMNLGGAFALHGQVKRVIKNFWLSLFSHAGLVAILYAGGFWK